MRSNKPWLIAFAFLLVFAFSANSALATTAYLRGYVKPSGDGASNCTVNGNCVQFDGTLSALINVDLFGVTGPQSFSYDLLSYSTDTNRLTDGGSLNVIEALPLDQLTIQAGDQLTFVFAGGVPTDTSQTFFGILACGGVEQGTNTGAIFDSSGTVVVSTKCTNFDTSSTLITTENVSGNSVTFTIAPGVTVPSQFAFSFPFFQLPMEIDVAAPVVTPEPASLSLLAAGLIGLGIFRRKRAT